MKQFEQEAPLTTGLYNPPDTTLHNIRSAVGVPLTQSFVVSCLVAVVFGAGWVVRTYPNNYFSYVLLIMSCVWLYSFLAGIGFWQWIIKSTERITQIDLNGDGEIEQDPPAPEDPPLRIDLVTGSEAFPRVDKLELPFASRLPRFCAAVLEGKAMTHKVFVSSTSPDKLFSGPEFTDLMKLLLGYGWIALRNEREVKRGYRLTDKGEKVFTDIAKVSPPPPFLNTLEGWHRR